MKFKVTYKLDWQKTVIYPGEDYAEEPTVALVHDIERDNAAMILMEESTLPFEISVEEIPE